MIEHEKLWNNFFSDKSKTLFSGRNSTLYEKIKNRISLRTKISRKTKIKQSGVDIGNFAKSVPENRQTLNVGAFWKVEGSAFHYRTGSVPLHRR